MPKGLTPFGREVRKLRIDAETSLKAMAEYLHVTSAYLSGIESGDRPLSTAVVERSIAFFRRLEIDAGHLRTIADGMRKSVDVAELDEQTRAAVAEFARRLSDMPQKRRHQAIDKWMAGFEDRE